MSKRNRNNTCCKNNNKIIRVQEIIYKKYKNDTFWEYVEDILANSYGIKYDENGNPFINS